MVVPSSISSGGGGGGGGGRKRAGSGGGGGGGGGDGKASPVGISNGTRGVVSVAPTGEKKKRRARKRKRAGEPATGLSKYSRGLQRTAHRGVADKKLKGRLKKTEKANEEAAEKAAKSEWLLPEVAGALEAEGMEKTFKFKQEEIAEAVDVQTAKKIFDLSLGQLGPYLVDYNRNGRYMLLGGKKGHVAVMDWSRKKLKCEVQVGETVRDVTFLHNETMFAVAQKKHVYVYDNTGTELHALRKHVNANRIEFLPFHFLLASVGETGYLKYQDTSTGTMIAEHRTRLGPCDCMAQNPYNAVINLGHYNGTVTLWSPNMNTPLVRMLCHRGPVRAIACDNAGRYMTTAGADGQMKVWDLRTYKNLHSYYTPTPVTSLAISQKGMLAVGHGPHVQIWKDALHKKAQSPYMKSMLHDGARVRNVAFCPYEDVLGVGHSLGLTSMIVPGAGEPNYDTLEANPFETRSQRREAEVKMVLEKLQPEMIGLDPTTIGNVKRDHPEVRDAESKVEVEANPEPKKPEKKKQRGRGTTRKKLRNRQKNVFDDKKMERQYNLEKRKEEKARLEAIAAGTGGAPSALARFKKL